MKADAGLRFEDFEQWLRENLRQEKRFDCLGGRSHFTGAFDSAEGRLHIKSSTDYDYYVPTGRLEEVLQRFKDLSPPERYEAGQYTRPKWPECPNLRTCPWVAAVIKYWVETDP